MHNPSTEILTSVVCVYYFIDPLFANKTAFADVHATVLKKQLWAEQRSLSPNLNIYHFSLSKGRALMQSNQKQHISN